MASFVAGIGISVFGSVASNFGVNGRFSSLHEKKKKKRSRTTTSSLFSLRLSLLNLSL